MSILTLETEHHSIISLKNHFLIKISKNLKKKNRREKWWNIILISISKRIPLRETPLESIHHISKRIPIDEKYYLHLFNINRAIGFPLKVKPFCDSLHWSIIKSYAIIVDLYI